MSPRVVYTIGEHGQELIAPAPDWDPPVGTVELWPEDEEEDDDVADL